MPRNKKPVDVEKIVSERSAVTEETIESVYQRTRSSIVRYVSRYFRRTQDAEDVVQEAFVKVIEAQRNQEISSPSAYLYRTARNLAINEIKRHSYKLTDSLTDIMDESDFMVTKEMEAQFEDQRDFEVFCRAVRSLPVKCRRAFVLCRVYGFSQREVAGHMDISVKAVEGHLARAARKCLDFMELEERIPKKVVGASANGRQIGKH